MAYLKPVLGRLGPVLACHGSVLACLGLVLGLSGPALGLSWVCLGPVLACLRSTLAYLGPFLGCLGLPWPVLGLSCPAARLSSNIFQHCAVRNCCNTCLVLCSFCVLVSFPSILPCLSPHVFIHMTHGLLQETHAGFHLLIFVPPLQRGGTCAAHPPPPEGMPCVPDINHFILSVPASKACFQN